MALRTPWFQQRSTLFGLSVLDAFWVGSLFNLVFALRLKGVVPGLDPVALLLICSWTGLSYLAGRYSFRRRGSNELLLELGRTALVAVLVLGLAVVVFNWGLKSGDPSTYRGFLIPLLMGVTLSSTISEQLVRQRLRRRRDPWLVVGSAAELSVIAAEELAIPGQPPPQLVSTSEVHGLAHQLALGKTSGWAGLAVGDLSDADEGVVHDLVDSRAAGLRVISLISWCETYLQRVPPELISPAWRLQAEGFELHPGSFSWRLKRSADLVAASLLLLLTTPLILLAALLIWLEDRGPVFYGQQRSSIYDGTMHILKLRTMRVDAEAQSAQWAQRDDPRITRTGQWLRKLRIDELPQLLNVLMGDMSLIGPRPERPEIDAQLEQQIPNYRLRYLTRPGLSGWAQVCFPYGASVADSRMKLSYDIFYLRNANPLLDLFILIKTMRLLLRGAGSEPR